MNNVNIIGTMVRDVELKYLNSGVAVGSFAIAVNQDYKNKEGQKVEKTSFFDIKVIGKQSETINQYFSKGSRIGITGELEQETWTTNDGQNRSKVVIKLSNFSFIDKKSDNQNQRQTQPQKRQTAQQQYPQAIPEVVYEQRIPEIDISEDEIPFN